MPARLFHEASNLTGFFDISVGPLQKKKKDQKTAKVWLVLTREYEVGIKGEGGLEYGVGQHMCKTNSRLCLVLMISLTPPMVANSRRT